ncbi:hypothetical protein TSH100_03965 [Azospirillum sp. TSH100]|uniref:DUF5131 family protein n=1 Tax=Azospirillum sp. TSH100 TaxID=652764 RepID=UPI000D61CE37|nr:DUF5131 family protein [Azospirillum sp. TSH100]PWC89802.1 hypothetical protein TSH100_03965 [Azospirillum sp. TSH100]QCG92342.1 DUF5131 family protein [Azospirillum sp. TSH100]
MTTVICTSCCRIGPPPPPPSLSCCPERRPIDLALIPRSIAKAMTGISWASFTANAWGGCTELAGTAGAKSGCAICYARTFLERKHLVRWGAGERRVRFASWRARVLRLDRMARETGLRFSVFAFSLADWLDPEVPPAWREEFCAIVEACTHLDWLLLTHRPHLARKLAPPAWVERLPDHVWPGVTVEHATHGFRLAHLADVWGDSGRLWVSAEPIGGSLAGVDLSIAACIILGGASNTTDPEWAPAPEHIGEVLEAYPDQVHFKQWGVFGADGAFHGRKERAGRAWNGAQYDWTPWPRHRELLKAAAQAERMAA